MYALTSAGQLELRQSHEIAVRLQVLHGGVPVYDLTGAVIDGQVTSDSDRPVMRTFDATLVDVDGTLSATDAGELLSPYDAEIAPYRGVVLPSGRIDWAPQGVFKLTNSTIADSKDGTTVSLTGQDRAIAYQVPLPGPVTIAVGTRLEDAIGALLLKVNGALLFEPWRTGVMVGPLIYQQDAQAWDAALTLAESVGGWLFHDRSGVCRLAPLSPSGFAGQRFADNLLSVSKDENADEIHNSVVMQSSDSGAVIRVIAEDLNTLSPTYVQGSYGRRQVTVTNPHLGSVKQAQQAATARLVQELGRSQAVSWECVPDPQTDPQDLVVVNRPEAQVTERSVVVASVSLPLSVDGSMKVTARQSVVGQDGSVPA